MKTRGLDELMAVRVVDGDGRKQRATSGYQIKRIRKDLINRSIHSSESRLPTSGSPHDQSLAMTGRRGAFIRVKLIWGEG